VKDRPQYESQRAGAALTEASALLYGSSSSVKSSCSYCVREMLLLTLSPSFFLAGLLGFRVFSSLTRIEPRHPPAVRTPSPKHGTARECPPAYS